VSNQNYDQVSDLVTQGKLLWATDLISALLTQSAAFDAGHTRLSQTGGSFITQAPIPGRYVAEGGKAMGLPATFPKVASGQEFQVLIVRNDGSMDPQLLAFLDEDSQGNPITVQRSGTLIVRPSQENLPVPPDTMEPPPTTGFWLKL
jgi:hypothetical protein